MNKQKKKILNFNSIIVKFLMAFLLFGTLLVLITVSIQNDLAETTTEELTRMRELQSISVLEENLGRGEWSVRGNCLYKGDKPVGDGIFEHADIKTFIETENETGSFVYSFIDSSLASDEVLELCSADGSERTAFLRVAGSTLGADGNPIVGTFLDSTIAEELLKNDEFSGRSFVGGRMFYCSYKVIRDADSNRVGAVVAGSSIEDIVETTKKSVLNSSLAVAVMIVYTFFALFLFVLKWNRSLKRTEKYLSDIGSGDFPEYPLKISGGDELGEMAEVINEMKESIKEKERLRNELELAKTIQEEMLPDEEAAGKLPPSCRVKGFMEPAREVGGDLYDFFMINEDRIGLVAADVSDKGAPSALFMATAKMCIKDNMMLGGEPGDVLARVNNMLLENNKSGMFVTAWIGVIDLVSGEMKYAMAGHPYPFIKRAESREYGLLKSKKNLVLANLPDFEYFQETTILDPGDRIFIYTDGLDEARDTGGGFFGRERIKECLDKNCDSDIRDTVLDMKKAVDDFAAGREQFDDLTMLMFEYIGGHRNE